MVVGRLESFGAKASKDVVFQRTQEQFLGAAIYMVVEMSLWRKSARDPPLANLQVQLNAFGALWLGWARGVPRRKWMTNR